jgi:26S proteasome regulatory subunit N13
MTPFLLEAEVEDVEQIDPNSETARMAMQTLEHSEKVEVLKRILRAPQLRAALGSLTEALKTGALPTVAQGLKIDVENGVKAFLEGVKKTVEKEDKKGDDDMDTS